jgi:hypothetical protein
MEIEPFGLDYERYALRSLMIGLIKKRNIRTILELPAGGIKAMPSIYSLAFGEAGCEVTLANASSEGRKVWQDLGYRAKFIDCADISKTYIRSDSFDLVWNFYTLSVQKNYGAVLEEMRRISRKYVLLVLVNGYNVGSPIHQALHKFNRVPWTHGDKRFLYPGFTKNLFRRQRLAVRETGVVDAPPWPDTCGFRDMRLHKLNIDPQNTKWHSKTINYIKCGRYPSWIYFLYALECLPLPWQLKLLNAHLYYVLGEK